MFRNILNLLVYVPVPDVLLQFLPLNRILIIIMLPITLHSSSSSGICKSGICKENSKSIVESCYYSLTTTVHTLHNLLFSHIFRRVVNFHPEVVDRFIVMNCPHFK